MRPRALATTLLGLGISLTLLAAGCIRKDPEAGDDDTTEACPEPFEGPMENTYDEIYNPDGIWRTCDPPPGSLCFDCHLGANDAGDSIVDATHYVCKHCHDENGDPLYEGGGCECGELDCEVDPPLLTCNECHTDGCNSYASAEQMNGLCDFCHVQPEGEAR